MKGDELRRWLNMGDHHYSSNVTQEDVDKACAAAWKALYAADEAAAAAKATDAVVDAAWVKYQKLKRVFENESGESDGNQERS